MPSVPTYDSPQVDTAPLSVEEKRLVPVEEVRRIEMQALRKVRRALLARGLSFENLSMG